MNGQTQLFQASHRIAASTSFLPLADESVDCIVTSPPYNAGIDYPSGWDDSLCWADYAGYVTLWASELFRVLKPYGRAWINIQPVLPINSARFNLQELWFFRMVHAGFQYRDTVAWVQDSFDGACAWGSWLSPSAPNTRGGWEAILCMFKTGWKRPTPPAMKGYKAPRHDLGGDWTDLCRNVWTLRPARKRPGAPAPFPIELPARCIRLSTWPGDIVLDPFAGSGTTGDAAFALDRKSVLVDLGWGYGDEA